MKARLRHKDLQAAAKLLFSAGEAALIRQAISGK